MLLKRENWVGNTTRPPLWTIHKSFGQRLQISKTEYIPVISTIFGLQSHTLFTQTEGRPVYKPLNSPRGSLTRLIHGKQVSWEATSAPCNRRARWGRRGLLTLSGTGGELEPEQRADVTRLPIGWDFTTTVSNGPWLDSCKWAVLCMAFHWYSLQLVAFQIRHTDWKG